MLIELNVIFIKLNTNYKHLRHTVLVIWYSK